MPSSNEHGVSERTQLRCSPLMLNAINAVVNSKVFPYKSPADFIRHACYRHLKWLQSLEPQELPETYITQLDSVNEILSQIEAMQNFQKFLDRSEVVLKSLLAAGDAPSRRQAAKIVSNIRAQLSQIPDSEEYWRDKVTKEWDARYGHLLGGAKGERMNGLGLIEGLKVVSSSAEDDEEFVED